MERLPGVEPGCDNVGTVVSHHARSRVWCLPLGRTSCRRLIGPALILMSLIGVSWSECRESNTVLPAPKAGGQPMTHARIKWSERQESNLLLPGSGPGRLPMTYS